MSQLDPCLSLSAAVLTTHPSRNSLQHCSKQPQSPSPAVFPPGETMSCASPWRKQVIFRSGSALRSATPRTQGLSGMYQIPDPHVQNSKEHTPGFLDSLFHSLCGETQVIFPNFFLTFQGFHNKHVSL